jgi:hypothetical protein
MCRCLSGKIAEKASTAKKVLGQIGRGRVGVSPYIIYDIWTRGFGMEKQCAKNAHGSA